MIDKEKYIRKKMKDTDERLRILRGEDMSKNNEFYFKDIIHLNDGYEEFPTLCGGTLGDVLNTDPKKVNCKKCIRFMKDSKRFAISRKLRKERMENEK